MPDRYTGQTDSRDVEQHVHRYERFQCTGLNDSSNSH